MREELLSLLPRRLAEEIGRTAPSFLGFWEKIQELRVRAEGVSALLLSGRSYPLLTRVTAREPAEILDRACGGSLYAYRDTLAEGYVPMAGGIRLGVAGEARYDGGARIGISEVRSLVFRFPYRGEAEVDGLLDAFLTRCKRGMLLYSPPGEGKTTVLRTLARRLGSGRGARRVVAVDERMELDPSFFGGATVDLLRGYRRAEGVEIALRTLSPEVLLIDEIGGRGEAEALLCAVQAGVPLIATAHAGSLFEVLQRSALLPFFRAGVFDLLAELSLVGGRAAYRIFGEEALSCFAMSACS